MNRAIISKPIDKVRDTDVPAPWPAQCALCDLVLASSEEARRHRDLTEDEDTGAHELVLVLETDEDLNRRELIEAMRAWESAECMTCSARFATRQEAVEHDSIGHPVFHRYGAKAVY